MKPILRRPFLILLILLVLAPGAAMLAGSLPNGPLGRLAQSRLGGVANPVSRPPWTPTAFGSGRLQSSLGLWLDERMGRPRELMIRLNNGIGYLTGRSFSPHVIIGGNRHLYSSEYVGDWCGEPGDSRQTARQVGRQAAAVARIRDAVEASGRPFVLVLSPGKPAIYPEHLDPTCREPSPGRYVEEFKAALLKRNVDFVDGIDLVLQGKASQDLPLFARDGLHWNALGASFAVEGIIRKIEERLQEPLRHLQVKDIAVDDRAAPGDKDLESLLNLPFELRPYPSIHPTFVASPSGEAPRLLMVGTSFSWQLLDLIGANRLSDDVTFYYYFSRIARFRSGEFQPAGESFAAAGDLGPALARAEAVVLELNEANVLADHVPGFAEALGQLKGN